MLVSQSYPQPEEEIGTIIVTVGAPAVGPPTEDERLEAVTIITDAIDQMLRGYPVVEGLFAYIEIK